MFTLPKSDPLDILVYGIGLRLTQLAKMGDPKFKKLLENRNFTIQMGAESQDIYRHFKVENGRFTQGEGKAVSPTLTIDFKDSMTGAKLLTKGDAAAFMVGIQSGDVKMMGDYSLLMWFNQVAKYIMPKIPEQLQPAVDMARPLISKATPVAKDLCDKAMSLLTSFGILGSAKSATKKDEKSDASDRNGKSKYFNEKNADDDKADSKSLVDTAKEKLSDVKADVEERVGELKEKFDEVKDKAEDLAAQAKDKLVDVKSDAETKVEDIKDKAEDLTTQAKDKLVDVKSDAETKVEDIKDKAEDLTAQAKDKLADVKTDVQAKVTDVKEETVKSDVNNIATESKTASQIRPDELVKAKEEAEKLSPAAQKSQELEAKHADDTVIAENIKIEAVKDGNSPITNVSVTKKA